jgi:hypothetical protein
VTGARWLAQDRGAFEQSECGQAPEAGLSPQPAIPEDIRPCPLYPLPMVARIDWASILYTFPYIHLEAQ